MKQAIRERIESLERAAKEIHDVAFTIDEEIRFLIKLLGECSQRELKLSSPNYKNVFQQEPREVGELKPITYTDDVEALLDLTMKGE